MKTKKSLTNNESERRRHQITSLPLTIPTHALTKNSLSPHHVSPDMVGRASSRAANVDPLETRDTPSPIDAHPKRVPSPGGEGQDEGEPPSRAAANISLTNPIISQSTNPVTFREYLTTRARVPFRDNRHGTYGPFTFEGRAPLDFIVTLIDKILANCLHGQTVEIDGVTFPGTKDASGAEGAMGAGSACLKGATITVGGGAQFGKTVLILNFQAFATFVEFINFGYYTPDQELLAKIVDTKFRPDVLDQQPWMAEMVQLGRAENASGRAVNRKNSYQVSSGGRKSFGHFCGMQKPPTTISLDAAALDEVDDIPSQNMGYVDGRMTGSRLQLKFEIGTQRIAGAGQNARLKAGTFHVMMYECPNCHMSWNLEEEFPRCIRIKQPARAALVTGRAELPLRPNISPSHPSTTPNASDSEMVGRASPRAANVNTLETSTTPLQPEPTEPSEPSPRGRGQGEGELPSRAAANISSPNQQSEISNQQSDEILSPESAPNRNALYYLACPNCGTALDRDSGTYIAKNPHRLAEAHFSVRVSQLNISAISLHEIVSAWHTALADPSGAALTAFYCDRLALPNAGAAQPITQAVLDQCRTLGLTESADIPQPYDMTFGPVISHRINPSNASDPDMVGRASAVDHRPRAGDQGHSHMSHPSYVSHAPSCIARFAGLDTGPRCWFWADEYRSSATTACIWAELIASGNAPTRIPLLMQTLGISCLFIDAGGEPDLTKRLVLALNGLENFTPPNLPRTDLLRMRLSNIGNGGTGNMGSGTHHLTWDGEKAQWTGLRAAAVLFVSGEAKGIEQTIGFTQEGRIYPLIKCNRAESIQTTVNDFLTPASGVYEQLGRAELPLRPNIGGQGKILRTLPRARLPRTCLGPGVTQSLLDSHLLNLRKERDPATGEEHWITGVENHLALAKVYARLATLAGSRPRVKVAYSALPNSPWSKDRIVSLGMGSSHTPSRQAEILRLDEEARTRGSIKLL